MLSWQDPNWQARYHDICYESGHWLVAPIVDGFGQRGIEYILSHPLVMPDGDAYTAARYQQATLSALEGPY